MNERGVLHDFCFWHFESIKSYLLVAMESTILWDLGGITQIIAPKRKSSDPDNGRCTFLVLRKSQITCWRPDHSQEHVSNYLCSVDIHFKLWHSPYGPVLHMLEQSCHSFSLSNLVF